MFDTSVRWVQGGCRILLAALIMGWGASPVAAAVSIAPHGGQQLAPAPHEDLDETVSEAADEVVSARLDSVDASGRVGERATSEWMFGAGAAFSVELFHSREGIRYGAQTVSWARDLTKDHGTGVLRGRLAWAVEVMPVLVESAPTRVYAFGVAPFVARWNFVPRRRWSAFTEVAGGFLGSSSAIPDGEARFNFTAHWGAGVRLPVSLHHGIVVAYRFHHISNGNRLPTNPGVNSHVAFVGWSVAEGR